jgi:hypothetical protein
MPHLLTDTGDANLCVAKTLLMLNINRLQYQPDVMTKLLQRVTAGL